MIGANVQIQNAFIAADRLFEIMDLEREKESQQIALQKDKMTDIFFEDVDFRYGTRVEIFDKFSLHIPKGKTTAIVGESGSGKSTIVSLLQNIYPIRGGKISIGAVNLAHIDSNSLRKMVGVVPQKVDLFSGNVIENIAVGEFVPDMDRIIEICKTIGIIKFIEELPNGFETHLGENGATLSGGQKQRIAIARALYKAPEILILDEATSSLDSKSENYIHKALEKLKSEQKTIIIISHRLSAIANADKIVVLEKGKTVEEGTHKDLLANKKHYFRLWKNQTIGIEKGSR